MTRTRSLALPMAGMLAVVACCLGGCDTKVDNPVRPGEVTQQAPPKSETVIEGGGAGLGKAKEAGTGIEQKVDEYNRQLEKQIDEINKK